MNLDTFLFGKKTGCYEPDAERIDGCINNEYSSDFLKNQIFTRI